LSVPDKYTEAYDNLVTFRKRIFEQIISGRVKAVLDAGHDTLLKYGDVIDTMSIIPYMFSNVKQKALALKISDLSVGVGEIHQAKATFALTKSSYPITSPPNVPARLLPNVDVFIYTPPSNTEIIEKTTDATWSNLFAIQVTKDAFAEVPDAENVHYDFYQFKPVGRVKVEATLSSAKPEFSVWNKLTGEATLLARELTLISDGLRKIYEMYVFVDANYHSTGNEVGVMPLCCLLTDAMYSSPVQVLSVGGKRIQSTEKGAFAGWNLSGREMGFTKTHDGYTVTSSTVLVAKDVQLKIDVNDIVYGTTDPVPDTYTKKTTDEVNIHGLPNVGYTILRWILDGINYPTADYFLVKCYTEHDVLCEFIQGSIVTMRPSANGDLMELEGYNDSPQWKCVDDVTPDDMTTYVANAIANCRKSGLFQLNGVSIPDNAVGDWIKVYIRCYKNLYSGNPAVNALIKTNGTVYISEDYYPIYNQWTTFVKEYTKNPFTDQPFTKAELLALQAGVRCENQVYWGSNIITDCTQVYVEAKYHVP
jgi:hypothetical protein